MNKITLFFIILFTSISCLQEIPLDTENADAILIVEGHISDLDETYKVKLSNISNYDGTTSENYFTSGAEVVITETDGQLYYLSETENGVYELLDEKFIGKIGRSYQLDITLTNGEKYQSSIETIQEKVNMLSAEAYYNERTILNENDIESTVQEHVVEVTIENTIEEHYYSVNGTSWREVAVYYGNCDFAFPPTCWAYSDPIVKNQLSLEDNIGLDNSNYKVKATSAPMDYKGEYIAIIRLNAMSLKSYLFWKSVNDQITRNGGVFDRPFAPINGNITHVNGDKQALGYFHAYAGSIIDICFDRSDVVAITISPGPIPCNLSCPDIYAPATYEDVSQFYCL